MISYVRLLSCNIAKGMEGVLECSGVDALAPADRLRVCGDLGTLAYDVGADVVHVGQIGDRALFEELRVAPYYRKLGEVGDDARGPLKGLIDSLGLNSHGLVQGDFGPKKLLVFEGGLLVCEC